MKTLSVDDLMKELQSLEIAEMEASGTLRRVEGAKMICQKLIADLKEEDKSTESDDKKGEVVPFKTTSPAGT